MNDEASRSIVYEGILSLAKRVNEHLINAEEVTIMNDPEIENESPSRSNRRMSNPFVRSLKHFHEHMAEKRRLSETKNGKTSNESLSSEKSKDSKGKEHEMTVENFGNAVLQWFKGSRYEEEYLYMRTLHLGDLESTAFEILTVALNLYKENFALIANSEKSCKVTTEHFCCYYYSETHTKSLEQFCLTREKENDDDEFIDEGEYERWLVRKSGPLNTALYNMIYSLVLLPFDDVIQNLSVDDANYSRQIRRLQQALVFPPVLINLHKSSILANVQSLWFLHYCLPVHLRSEKLELVYSSYENGYSWSRFSESVTNNSPLIVLIRDRGGNIFGACIEDELEYRYTNILYRPNFYGEDCFLFSLYPNYGVWREGFNRNYVYFNGNTSSLPNGLVKQTTN